MYTQNARITGNFKMKMKDHLLLGGEHVRKVSPGFHSPMKFNDDELSSDEKKEIEDRVSKFIETQEKPGIKYKGNQFLPQTKQVVDRKRSTKMKESSAVDVLKQYGMSEGDSKVVVGEIIEAMRGPRKEETKLLIKKTKN